jgi:hypothetical protein
MTTSSLLKDLNVEVENIMTSKCQVQSLTNCTGVSNLQSAHRKAMRERTAMKVL